MFCRCPLCNRTRIFTSFDKERNDVIGADTFWDKLKRFVVNLYCLGLFGTCNDNDFEFDYMTSIGGGHSICLRCAFYEKEEIRQNNQYWHDQWEKSYTSLHSDY